MNPVTTVTREVQSLIEAVCDGMADDAQVRDLESLLLIDEETCNFYVDMLDLDAKLQRLVGSSQKGDEALKEFVGAKQTPPQKTALTFLSTPSYGTINYFADGWPLAYLLAAVILGLGIVAAAVTYVSQPVHVASALLTAQKSRPAPEPNTPCVGKITGMVDCKWNGSSRVSLGQKYELASGLLEITYDTGAKIILQGPVAYSVEANGGYLSVGKLTGKLEKGSGFRGQGSGAANHKSEIRNQKSSLSTIHYPLFTIRTPTATVTDLGTEFGVEVNKEGVTETEVFTGTVKVARWGDGANDPLGQIVCAGNALCVDGKCHHLTAIKPSERRFVRVLPADAQTRRAKADAYAQLVLSMQPFAYYRMERPMDPKDKTVVFDSAPGGHHGKLCLGNKSGNPWQRGRFGDALVLRGWDNSYVDVQDFPTSDTDQLSVSVWVYRLGRNWWAKIASEGDWTRGGDASEAQFHLGLYDSDGDLVAGVTERKKFDVRVREGAPNVFPVGQWQHVAFVADGSVLHLYRNGVEVAASPYDGLLKVPPIRHLTIGCQNITTVAPPVVVEPACFWQGGIDELAIFYHALSAEQIRQLYAERPAHPTTTTEKKRGQTR